MNSRNEVLLRDIIDDTKNAGEPQSRIEEILTAIRDDVPIDIVPVSRAEALLLAIKNDGEYVEEPQSRNEAILLSILNDTPYEDEPLSPIEALLLEWKENYGRLVTISGIPPIEFTSKGKPLASYSITGNTVQDGTPTPEQPVEVKMVGDRTGNLCTNETPLTGYYSDGNGQRNQNPHAYLICVEPIKVEPNTQYTISTNTGIYSVWQAENTTGYGLIRTYPTTTGQITITTDEKCHYLRISINRRYGDFEWLMVNAGSTPLPYEPPGYKIPVVTRGKNWFDCYGYSALNIERPSYDRVLTNSYGTTISSTSNTNKLTVTQTVYGSPSDAVNYKNGFFNIGVYGLKEGQRYILSFDATPSNFGILTRRVMSVFPNGQGLGNSPIDVTSYLSLNKKTRITLTFVYHDYNERKYIELRISGVSGVYENFQIESIIEPSTPPTPYEPYHPPITTNLYLPSPLAKGETLRSDGNRDVKWKEMVLTGDEDWKKSVSFTGVFYLTNLPIDYKKQSASLAANYRSTHFKAIQSGPNGQGMNDGELRFYNGNVSVQEFYINKSNNEAVADLKQWLKFQYEAGTPVTVYYQLATPTTEQIDMPTLETLTGTNTLTIDTEVQPEDVTITGKGIAPIGGFELTTGDGQPILTGDGESLATKG